MSADPSVRHGVLAQVTARPVIDGDWLMAEIAAIAAIGATAQGGVERIAYGEADLLARDHVEHRMRALGMQVARDAAGNSVGRLPGLQADLAAIATGSHTDSVPDGGHYDGVLGVTAGLAAIEAMVRAGYRPRHPVEVINFAAEEGALAGGTFGSRAMAGISVEKSLADTSFDGTPVSAHLRRAGIDPATVANARRAPGTLAAFFELHIEQGGEL
ncbi:MAG TPA: M20/M25/M40 family metallo-hydrolase, partial [Paenirhodobacter sp.]